MTDEIEFDFDVDQDVNNRNNKRITDLSEKVRVTSQERDELAKAKADADAHAKILEKERDFYSTFSDVSAKYPGAHEHKDQIKEKVMTGYDAEDATISILVKEGKLQNAPVPKESPAGGSATNAHTGDGEKPINEMSRDEKRALLEKNLDIT